MTAKIYDFAAAAEPVPTQFLNVEALPDAVKCAIVRAALVVGIHAQNCEIAAASEDAPDIVDDALDNLSNAVDLAMSFATRNERPTVSRVGISTKPPAYISIKQLASDLKMDRSSCRRWVLSQGVEPIKKRMPDSHFQVALAVPRDVADRLIAERKEDGYL